MKSTRVRIVAWFLAVTYGLGAVGTAWIEYDQGFFSDRFSLPPGLIYAVAALQLVCAIAVLTRSLAPWAALGFTVTSLGAIWAHLRIGSPQTATAAVVYSIIQIWFGWQHLRNTGRRATSP